MLTGTTFASSGNGVYSLTGSPTEVQAALAAVKFAPANNYNGVLSVAVAISDGANGRAARHQPDWYDQHHRHLCQRRNRP